MTPLMTSPWWSSWSESVWRASWQGALCALAVWLLARAVPRLPAALRAGLWWLVALKFVLTLGWPKPMPLALLPVESTAAQSQTVRLDSAQSQTQGQTVMVLTAPDATVRMRLSPQEQTPVHVEPPSARARAASLFKGAVASLRAHPWTVGGVWALLVLWGAGVAWKVRGHVLAWRQVRGMRERARPLRHPMLEEEAEFLANEAGLRRPPTLLVSDEVVSPLAAGLLSPVIVLPAKALRDLPEDSLRMALAHEIAHLRRGDLWLGWVPALAETVLFFHPLARQAAREYALAREEACDAEALRLTGAEPADYGELLIAFGITRPPGSAAALGASAHLHALHRRLRMLEHVDVVPTQPRRWLKGALFALGAVVLMPFQVVAKAPAESTAPAAKDAAPAPVKVGTVRTLPEDAAPAPRTTVASRATATPAPDAKPSSAAKPTATEHSAKAPGTPADATPLPALPPLPPPTPGKATTQRTTLHVPPSVPAPAPIPDGDKLAPVPPVPPAPPVGSRPTPPVPPAPPARGVVSPVAPMAPMLAAAPRPPAPPAPPDMDIEDGDTFAYLSDGRTMMAGSTDDLYLARTFKQTGKDLLFVRRDNKPMLIRDAKTLEQVRKLMEDDRKLGDAQGSLGEKQAALGKQQAELGQKQADLAYPMSQIAAKHAAIASKRAEIAMERARLHSLADGPERDRKEAELDKRDESFDKELEGLDKEQEALSEKMEALGEEQGKLGEQQGKLGEEQAKLGLQQAARSRENMKKVMAVIDEAIRKGLAEPLPT
ncbi:MULTISPECIES: M56 family metallopeptidase [unclassified Corallococcus]|uniref:M56 family metallopeptidase n=1 Tax=unclassified Corallococcus TaxID=2685029 RepID=UPI001A8DD1D6|nr:MULTISPECIES: M56 family metallopeptidase [unclassified Corallococcus]MBN9682154.1 biotin transporter BioY [Corallococcus sp. NCSPR001]WAS86286.1 biotin transporter BioY [Corallococcus sp. NCRR]